MDENKEEKKNVKQEKNSSFKTVQNPSSYKNYENTKKILNEIFGSDHCPIELDIDID